jgi:hypothetical protein
MNFLVKRTVGQVSVVSCKLRGRARTRIDSPAPKIAKINLNLMKKNLKNVQATIYFICINQNMIMHGSL